MVPTALMNDTERLDLVAAALGGFVYDWDLVSGVVSRTAVSSTCSGTPPEEIATDAEWWHERVHPDDLTRVEAATRAAASTIRSNASQGRLPSSSRRRDLSLDRQPYLAGSR